MVDLSVWHKGEQHSVVFIVSLLDVSQYDNTFFFYYRIFMSHIMLYFLHSTLVLSFYIDVVLTFSIGSWMNGLRHPRWVFNMPLIAMFYNYRRLCQQDIHTKNAVIVNCHFQWVVFSYAAKRLMISYSTLVIYTIISVEESIKATSMENVSAGVLEKIKNNI